MKNVLVWICLTILYQTLSAQESKEPRFYKDIQAFKELDRQTPPPDKAVLLLGSSSFTMWKDVQDYFPKAIIINRGFGGSTLEDLIRYSNDVAGVYNPKKIIIYCGENDLASSDDVSAATVTKRFITLFSDLRTKFDKVPIVYVSMKPSPSRTHLLPKMKAGNEAIKQFLKRQKNTDYVDVYSMMIDAAGNPLHHIFLEDQLHMNAEGYKIWQKALKKHIR